ncbi:MAG: leucine-rich repeat protein [Bacteroidales bacterium]|nr:leucine-rich repeat protein [Bacteroidales bacterium]
MKHLLLCTILFAVTTFSASAYDFSSVSPSGHTLYYNIVDGHAEVVRPYASTGTNSYISGALIIPASVEYNGIMYPVTKLSSLQSNADGTFQDCNMTSVVIPSSITEIGFAAFHQCDSLTSVIVPATVSTIGASAFSYCDNLRSIYFCAQNPPSINWSTFAGTPSDKVIYVPDQYYQNYTNAWSYLNYNVVGLTLQFDITINANNSAWGVGIYSILGPTVAEITAMSNYGYHFDHWSYGSNANPDTLYLTEDVTVTAYFAINQYTIVGATNDSIYGSVTGDTTVNYLDTVTLTAVANTGYHFVRWSDYTIDNPKTIVATSDMTKTAYFAPNEYNINLSVDSFTHGTCTGGGSYQYSTIATLEAIPYSGYRFSHWSDGATYNPYTLAVTDDVQLTAYFYADGAPYQDTIVVYDTLFVIMPIHDTTVVHVFDTIYIDVHDTTYVNVHDTTIEYINHYIHDTTFINNYVHDTMIQFVNHYVHDTTFVNNYVHDTMIQFVNQYVHDTTFVNNYIHDTVRMTTQMFDTAIVNVYHFDTAIYNTYHFDTLIVNNHYYDTVYITTHHYDTIYITEQGINGVDGISAKVYSSRGQVVVEGAEGNMVTLYDVNGRVLATKQDNDMPLRFDAPVSGTYMIKIGNYPARKVVVVR